MNFAAFERAQAAAFAYREGRHTGSLACLRAILFILRNRVRSGWGGVRGGAPWLAVMEAAAEVAAQDSVIRIGASASGDEIANSIRKGLQDAVPAVPSTSDDRLLQMIVRDVDDIYLGQESFDDPVRQVVCGTDQPMAGRTGPVLYYSFVDRPLRLWFVENIIRKPVEHPQVGQVGGKMMLYR
jgi:hypothetical protein